MRVRVGTIVWGAILLAFAAIAFGVAVFDLREFQAAAVAWIATGLGAVFVLAAIIALIARAVSRSPEPEVSTGSTTSTTEAEPEADVTDTAPKIRTSKGQPVD